MAKKAYKIPVIIMPDGDEPGEVVIVIGGSQGTIGDEDQYSFSGIDDDTLSLIDANCDDTDFAQMDTDKDLVITLAEFNAWFAEHHPW